MPSDAELLKAYLADRDVPCPGCGYSLKGCVADKCPECARRVILQLSTPPRVVRWIWLVRVALLTIVLEGGYIFYSTVLSILAQGWSFGFTTLFSEVGYWAYVGCNSVACPFAILMLVRTYWPRAASHPERIEKAAIGVLVLLVFAHGIPNTLGLLGRLAGWH